MCDAKQLQLATKVCGNINEKVSQDQTYDVDAVCATKSHGKLRRNFVHIAMKIRGKL
jgi:hypothetical protein